jgi:hypothetical protein
MWAQNNHPLDVFYSFLMTYAQNSGKYTLSDNSSNGQDGDQDQGESWSAGDALYATTGNNGTGIPASNLKLGSSYLFQPASIGGVGLNPSQFFWFVFPPQAGGGAGGVGGSGCPAGSFNGL